MAFSKDCRGDGGDHCRVDRDGNSRLGCVDESGELGDGGGNGERFGESESGERD